MLTFSYPWLFLLLPLPWLVRVMLPPVRSPVVSIRVPFGRRLQEATSTGAVQSLATLPSRWQVFPGLVWGLVLIALVRPQWIEPPVTKELPTRDLLLLVDLSGSMQQKDFKSSAGNTVDRLEAVKQVLGDFLEQRKGDRVGLVVFGDAPYLQAPFSTDLQLSRRLLDECQVGMAGPKTAFGDAIGLGVNLFGQSTAPAKTMIALTDGNDTKSQVPPVDAARIAHDEGIHIHTVAIGDPTVVGEDKLDEQALRDVAEAAEGKYYFAADRESLAGIYDELDKIETRKVETISHRPRRDLFYWPLVVAVLLSILLHAWKMVIRHRLEPKVDPSHAINVNPVTGELELI
ncbi:VWA domain-containing protein [Roseiconus lacunae]|uniref:VWA domain-containing protein n=1 Tax=Roseiconus lacunae TaxID=2605694 RepID=UPI00308CD73D|nr:VWA domain-containing protein [Stieleria sp. HD01]